MVILTREENFTPEAQDKTGQQRMLTLFESFDEAYIATNWDLEVIYWNKAAERVTTVKAKDAIGKKLYAVLPEMVTVDYTNYLALLQSNQRNRFMMNVISRETNKPSIFEVSMYPSEQGIVIVVEDKTEEERTKRLSAIGATAGMVGHDMRNPLQAIIGDIYLLKETLKKMPEIDTKREVAESLDNIETNVNYINKIIADLQDYSRTLKPDYMNFNLYNLVANILQTVSRQNDITISVFVDASLNFISDMAMIRRILTNLIVNAIQAMPNGGKLTLTSFLKNDKVIITVEDTGVGIPDDVKPKIFSPMLTTKAKGQGLGLSVVKRLTEAIGGTVSFESQIGKGTKFTISLPSNPKSSLEPESS